MPTQTTTENKQTVRGRFKEKTLEEKVQDMSTQVQRIKAEIADSDFYRLAVSAGTFKHLYPGTFSPALPALPLILLNNNQNLPFVACKL